jgi:hypothetical protein
MNLTFGSKFVALNLQKKVGIEVNYGKFRTGEVTIQRDCEKKSRNAYSPSIVK